MMKSFGDLIKNSHLSSPILKGVRAAQVLEDAEKWLISEFGEGIKEIASPAYFKIDTLTIACLSSTAAQEIRLRERTLLDVLNNANSGIKVKKIRYMS